LLVNLWIEFALHIANGIFPIFTHSQLNLQEGKVKKAWITWGGPVTKRNSIALLCFYFTFYTSCWCFTTFSQVASGLNASILVSNAFKESWVNKMKRTSLLITEEKHGKWGGERKRVELKYYITKWKDRNEAWNV
jgi:hypothetical protein